MKLSAQKEFNKPETIAFISNYPTFDKKGVMGNIAGVSKYTYYLLSQLKNDIEIDGRKAVVLADIVDKNSEDFKAYDNVYVSRTWRKDDTKVYKTIISDLKKLKKVKKIFVHFEFNMYGDFLTTLKFPLFLLKLKLKKKNVTLLIHQVVEDMNELGGHLNVKNNSIKMKILNSGIKCFYWMVTKVAEKVVVHDTIFSERLKKINKKARVFVVPHGMVDSSEFCEVIDPRAKIGLKRKDFVVLVFGFLTWYKGSDWISKQFVNYYKKTKDTSIKLILAGGESANLKHRKFYQKYYTDLINMVREYPNVLHTGFVPDELIQDYYCAADVVIFPYRTHMSASGPFSLALSFDRPFLISDSISSVLDTLDIKKVMSELNIKKEDICFSLNKPGDMFRKIGNLVNNKKEHELMSVLSKRIKEERDWARTAEKFLFVIDA